MTTVALIRNNLYDESDNLDIISILQFKGCIKMDVQFQIASQIPHKFLSQSKNITNSDEERRKALLISLDPSH